MVDAFEEKFTGFIFKIQANMDPDHRDRVAFMRLCSGKFSRNMRAFHVRSGKWQRLGRPTQFMAQDRSLVDEAYAGDIVGIHDPGIFAIGDSLTEGENLQFTGIPVFAPEHFMRVELKDPLKSKQLNKALDQLSEEGAVQVFRPLDGNSQYLGVVGPLQFDVVKFRIKAEYNVEVQMSSLPFEMARWLHCKDAKKLDLFISNNRHKVFLDQHDKPALLLEREWQLKIYREDYPDMEFFATSQNLVS
jgi:peptide chain release factor 3